MGTIHTQILGFFPIILLLHYHSSFIISIFGDGSRVVFPHTNPAHTSYNNKTHFQRENWLFRPCILLPLALLCPKRLWGCSIVLQIFCLYPNSIGVKYSLIVLGGGAIGPCLCFDLLIGPK